jgi:hypothetical protein
MHVYVVCKSGPEWCIPVEAHDREKVANERCKVLDSRLNRRDVINSLSAHTVYKVPLYPAGCK